MRYQNWDVLVFPDQSKIPLQEFKAACQNPTCLKSTHICFRLLPRSSQVYLQALPSASLYTPGRIQNSADMSLAYKSLWNMSCLKPASSSMEELQGKNPDDPYNTLVNPTDFMLYRSKWFDQNGPWPTIIDISIDLDKQGEFEKLKFPTFHKELLSQSYWNAGDDLGRIKLVIAEGFSRDNLAYPFERVKNIVSFSFQHAPLDVLETSSIAWPNESMWRQVSVVGPYYSQQFSPRGVSDIIDAHSHSPRHTNTAREATTATNSTIGSMFPPPPSFPRQAAFDPFTEPVHSAFTGWRQPSSDVSMGDYSSSNTRASASRNVSDPMILAEKQDRRFESMQMAGAFESICEALSAPPMPAAPVNTPQNGADTPLPELANAHTFRAKAAGARQPSVKLETDPSLRPTSARMEASIINSVKSRQNNVHASPLESTVNPSEVGGLIRKVSLQIATENHSGTKRQRVITPAASKVIDYEDEPRSSPSIRKVSVKVAKQDSKEGGRKVLGGIENV
ncbi:hypothetical protein LOCC1_G003560 [Lachnellula occidentalis]|uniref:Uncharacterized protein n=1 Tax=Lachnellula occidentalis TaxID=215460 RepID=A0A8H8RTK8_9HELO|nr:hypothetical protein LOCC1_G003560 [Lachnellula occidentalis]